MNNDGFTLEKHVKEDFTLSSKLDEVTKSTLLIARRKRQPLKYVSVFVVVLVAYILLINISSGFRVIANNIPGIRESIKWFYFNRDYGIEKAVLNEYKDYGPMMVENEDYIIYLDHIIIDEARVNITARYKVKNEELNKEMLIIAMPNDFGERTSSSHEVVNDEPVSKLDIKFKLFELKDIISNDGIIQVDMQLFDGQSEHPIEVGKVKVTVLDTDIALSNEHLLNIDYQTVYGDIYCEKLISYPTRTELLIRLDDKNPYTISKFNKLYIQLDSSTKTYAENNFEYYYKEDGKRYIRVVFNDSCYYNQNRTIYIGFLGYFFDENISKEIDVDLNKNFPIGISYKAETIWIDKILYDSVTNELIINSSNSIDDKVKGYSLYVEENDIRYKPKQFGDLIKDDESNIKVSKFFKFSNIPLAGEFKIVLDNVVCLIEDENEFTWEFDIIN